MSDPDTTVFVEFGVGLAGFSGVVVAFAQRSGQLGDYDRFRVIQLLLAALIPAFLGVFPIILRGFGIEGAAVWRIVGATLMVSIAVNTGVAILTARGMSPGARSSLSPAVWCVALGSSIGFFVWNGLNLADWPRSFSPGPVVAGLAWFLGMASLMFFRLLLVRLGDADGD